MTGAQLLAGCVTAPEDLAELAGVQEVAPSLAVAPPPQPAPPAGRRSPSRPSTDLAAWRAQRDGLIATARLPGSLSATRLAALGAGRAPGRTATPATATGRRPLRGAGRRAAPRRRRARPGQAGGRPRPAGLAEGPVRHRHRPGRPRRAPGGRPGHRRRHRGAWPRPRPRPRASTGEQERIAALARSALAAPSVVEAAALPHWREVYVGCPSATPCWRATSTCSTAGPDGLVVVDHKTDRVADDAELAGEAGRLPAPAGRLRRGGGAGHRGAGGRGPPGASAHAGRREGRGRPRPAAPRWPRPRRLVGSERLPHRPGDASAGQAQLFDDAGYERLGGTSPCRGAGSRPDRCAAPGSRGA